MNYLIIGLGSMGKRRIRNLKALGVDTVAGFDPREDRRQDSAKRYGIQVYDNLETAMNLFNPDAFIISTPPQLHMKYAYYGFEKNICCFIEASVVDSEKIKQLSEKIKGKNIVMAPSCTMRFYPGPKKIKELLDSKIIGKILNINYHTGQYLADWHPWESIHDYYVSKYETGGAREIVPFELTWLNDIFGVPLALACVKAKQTDLLTNIDDIYHCLLQYKDNVIINLTVDVISRPKATRHMRILGSDGEIVFDTDSNCVRYINTLMSEWKVYKLDTGTIENQYINPEEPYITEMRYFVNAVKTKNQSQFPNSLNDDYLVLKTLLNLEQLTKN